MQPDFRSFATRVSCFTEIAPSFSLKISSLRPGVQTKTWTGRQSFEGSMYLQWTKNGKKKSKYVDDAVVDDLRAKIERRRELQKREKELKL